MNQLVEDIRNFLSWKVAAGFEDDDQVVANAVNSFEGYLERPQLLSLIGPIATELIEAHRRVETEWPDITDCDRLDWAFADLERQCILARQDYWCCSTCSHSAAWAEVEQAQAQRPVKGYVFCHNQDTEGAVYGSSYLAYGAVEEGDEALIGMATRPLKHSFAFESPRSGTAGRIRASWSKSSIGSGVAGSGRRHEPGEKGKRMPCQTYSRRSIEGDRELGPLDRKSLLPPRPATWQMSNGIQSVDVWEKPIAL